MKGNIYFPRWLPTSRRWGCCTCVAVSWVKPVRVIKYRNNHIPTRLPHKAAIGTQQGKLGRKLESGAKLNIYHRCLHSPCYLSIGAYPRCISPQLNCNNLRSKGIACTLLHSPDGPAYPRCGAKDKGTTWPLSWDCRQRWCQLLSVMKWAAHYKGIDWDLPHRHTQTPFYTGHRETIRLFKP